MSLHSFKPKSFWNRPEGTVGIITTILLLAAVGYMGYSSLNAVIGFISTTGGLISMVITLGILVFLALDSRARSLLWYMYKSTMRMITGLFIEINPMAILKSYIDELSDNLKKMKKQMIKLRAQKNSLKEMILNNKKMIQTNLELANDAKKNNKQSHVILKTRKAGRLQDSNIKLETLYKKVDILDKVLHKMYDNSEVLKEDVVDQIKIKEQEFKAIKASHSAMESAMNVIRGDKDKREVFEMALESIADDVSQKVGEMEEFMQLSESFMDSMDLQNGIFEEEGLKLLEKWEKEGTSLILGNEKQILLEAENEQLIDLQKNPSSREKVLKSNQYDELFD